MAYDDDSSFGRWDDLLVYLQQLRQRDELTIPQLADLVDEVHRVTQGRSGEDVSLAHLGAALKRAGFGAVSIGVVENAVQVASQIPEGMSAAENVTLAQARHILGQGGD